MGKRFIMNMPEKLHALLRQVSKEQHVSSGAFACRAIQDAIDDHLSGTAEKRGIGRANWLPAGLRKPEKG